MWYKLSQQLSQTAEEQQPVEPTEVEKPTVEIPQQENPTDIVDIVVDDFKNGRNIQPLLASSEALTKEALLNPQQKQVAPVKAHNNHYRHKNFNKMFAALPVQAQGLAKKSFRKMLENPALVALKRIPENGKADIWSAQITQAYRALAVKVGHVYIWYWIGTHEGYNKQKSIAPPNVIRNKQ